jgi:hypothetical protein
MTALGTKTRGSVTGVGTYTTTARPVVIVAPRGGLIVPGAWQGRAGGEESPVGRRARSTQVSLKLRPLMKAIEYEDRSKGTLAGRAKDSLKGRPWTAVY